MTKYFLLATLFFVIACSAQEQKKDEHKKIEDNYKPIYSAKQLSDKLEVSFNRKKTDSLAQFFIDWNRMIQPNTDEFIHQNDTIANLYNIYKAFYKPLDLLKLGDWEWGNKLNEKCSYVAVQNKLFYSILATDNFDDFDWEKTKQDSISNFRPPTDLDKNKVLYLTNEYEDAINNFLGTESTKFGEGDIMNTSHPAGESEKRYEQLRPYIPILHGHWGGYWHIETHPDVNIVIFNKTLTKAKIDFRVGYQGGEAILEKKGDKWVIKESKATWIE